MNIHVIKKGDKYWDKTAEFANTCGWVAGPHLYKLMKENRFGKDERVIIAEEKGEIIGYCTFSYKDELPEGFDYTPCTGFVFVAESFRGNRISQKMIEKSCGYAKSLGYENMYICSGWLGLYEKFGYKKIGEFVNDAGHTENIFVKSLSDSKELNSDELEKVNAGFDIDVHIKDSENYNSPDITDDDRWKFDINEPDNSDKPFEPGSRFNVRWITENESKD